MSSSEDIEKAEKKAEKAAILKYASELRKFEIERFWQRSLFFWGFEAVAIATYGAAYLKGPRELQFAAACVGIICSLVWTLTNRGSKYWQEIWESKASEASKAALSVDIFEETEVEKSCFPWPNSHFSVSALATSFSDFTLLVWLALSAKAALGPTFIPHNWMVPVAAVGTVTFAGYVFFFCKRKTRTISKPAIPN